MKVPKGQEVARIDEAVVDTGPLFSALALNYVQAAQIAEPKKTSMLNDALQPYFRRYRYDESFQRAFLLWFGAIKVLVTTSHVIAEVQGLLNSRLKLKGEDRRYFWVHSVEFLRMRGLSEELLRLLDLSSQSPASENVFQVGPTDAGLIELARRKGLPLVTEDGELASLAMRNEVPCQLVKDMPLK